ncbi:MAG: ABC transporter permease [Caldilineaceae bacterium]
MARCCSALIFILFAVVLRTDEFLTGIALNLFALGATTYLLRQIFGVKGAFADAAIIPIPRLVLPWLAQIPLIGPILAGQNLVVYLAILATAGSAWLIFRSRYGLRLRAAGYNAPALAASGVSVARVRSWSLLLCGVLCGLAGAFLSLGYVRLFSENMSAGRGWISLAAIILVKGNPWGIAVISLLFGFFDGVGLLLQRYGVPSQFTTMAPYLATLGALYVFGAGSAGPQEVICYRILSPFCRLWYAQRFANCSSPDARRYRKSYDVTIMDYSISKILINCSSSTIS